MKRFFLLMSVILMAMSMSAETYGPLLTAKWSYEAPFNNQCKFVYNGTTYTCEAGPAAIAASMVLHYWRYPKSVAALDGYSGKLTTSSSSVDYDYPELPATTFDWGNMKDDYNSSYNKTQADAVATLVRYAGHALSTNYGFSGSETYPSKIVDMFVKFGYDATTCRLVAKSDYSESEWATLIQDEIKASRPVVYRASNSSGDGHAFVVDGYDPSNDTYHVNFGWGGDGNDWLKMNSFGYGSDTYLLFNQDQKAVVGIQPPTYAPVMQPANVIYISSTSFRADWTDETSDNMVDSYTLEVLPAPLHLLRGSWYPESSYADISLSAPWRGSRVRGGMNVIYFRNSNSQPGSITYTIPDGYTNATFALKITTGSGTDGKGNLTVETTQTAAVTHTFAAGETYSWVVTASSGEMIKITTTDNNYSPDMALIAVYEGDGTENRIITGITDKSYTVEDLETDGTYQYRVKAIYTNGTESKWSNDEEVTITQKVPYAVLDGTTLTFYYDENKAAWADEVGEANVFFSIPWDIDHSFTNDLPDWTSSKGNTTISTATFDESFGDYGLKSTRCMFYRMTALKTINHLEYLNTENVTDMGYMFDGCSALKTLDLSSFNTSKVTYMGFMFYNCPSLETLNLGDNFNTANVTHMNYMFANCEALKTLDLSNFNTAKVFNMDLMFYNCQALETLDLSNFNTSEVTYMRYMFEDCSSLETIYCAEGTDWSGVSNTSNMFSGCTSLSGKYGSKEFKFDGTEDGTYAKVYDGTNGGYFTYKGNRSYTLEVGEAGMATLYLDFDALIPEGVEVYCCEGLKDDEALPEAYAVKITQGVIPANTGVFVKAEPGKYLFNAFIPVETDGVTQVLQIYPDNILTGTLEEKEVGSHEVLTLGYSNQTNELGFWWFTGKTPIPANRAYIPGDKLTEGGVKGIRIVFDEETGIEEIVNGKSSNGKSLGAWYTIDGRKLEGKPQQRGLYINNGKKIIIK